MLTGIQLLLGSASLLMFPLTCGTPSVPHLSHLQMGTSPTSHFTSASKLTFHRNDWTDSRSSTPPPARGGYGGTFERGGRGNAFSSPRSASHSDWASRGPTPNGNSPRDSPAPRERETFGYGTWRDGAHIPGGRNTRMEKELYGELNDPSKQQTGINFEKYDDIPVEATGAGVPEPVLEFSNSSLDPVLLENIGYARYTVPTPVQKYSIPIVANGRDLMACAQVSIYL